MEATAPLEYDLTESDHEELDSIDQLPESSELTPALEGGRIICAQGPDEIRDVLRRWRRAGVSVIAHDLECAASATLANGSGLHPHLGTIRLAQFAVADGGDGHPEALVIDCWQDDPAPALKLLEEADTVLVHHAPMETRWLDYYHGLRMPGLIDTARACRLLAEADGYNPNWRQRAELGQPSISFSLGAVCARELGIALDKSHQDSYWDAKKLSSGQKTYAGRDVLALLDLWQQIEGKLNTEMTSSLRDEGRNYAAKPLTDQGRNDESERALEMIRASRSLPELERISKALPYQRIHHSQRTRIKLALGRQRKRLQRDEPLRRPSKLQMPSWQKPF